jgi:uncharacterized protein
MKKVLFIFLLAAFVVDVAAQDTSATDGFTVYYFENGKVSSEGIIRNGKPDGYWITYYPDGTLKSEGNRNNFELDSIWTFYNESGEVSVQIEYDKGKKNGIRRIIHENEIIEENFVEDVKQGYSKHYYPDGKLWKEIFFEDGLESGIGKEFAQSDGRVIKITYFEKGFITDIENINRLDKSGLKQGKWMFFYENGNVKEEGDYRNDLKHGYFKTYATNGVLLSTAKYLDGVLQEDVEELAKLDIKREYYPSGQVKTVASFKDDVPQGIRREYSPEGEITAGFVFSGGIIVGEGITDEEGIRDGLWKEYYTNGQLKSTGMYDAGKRTDEWKFYYSNGQLEQTGFYTKDGKPNGAWTWYYMTGDLLREESYYNGLADGYSKEYDQAGNILSEGEYIEGMQEGIWKYSYGDYVSEGEYLNGMRHGNWKHFSSNGKLSFEGEFIEDNPNGRHIWYWPDGTKKTEGNYIMGSRHGEWIKYNPDGSQFISIFYENGIETRFDGIRVRMVDEEGGMVQTSSDKTDE